MPGDELVGLRFDAVADQYHRCRPGYPDPMFDHLESLVPPVLGASVLEVGCGSGQATRSLLGRGYRVLAVEPGPAMARVAREQIASDRFEIEPALFDSWDPAGRRFHLVFSATAYHWVDPAVRWAKAATVLKEGGFLTLATNRTVSGSTFDELDQLSAEQHTRYGVDAGEAGSPSETELIEALRAAPSDIGTLWGVAEPKGGSSSAAPLFAEPTVRWFRWDRPYRAADAVGLLSTYSPYLALPPERRRALLAELEELINTRFGGRVTRCYLAILVMAQRR